MRVRSPVFWDYCERLFLLSGRPHPASDILQERLAAQAEGIGQATTYEWANLLQHRRAITGAGTQRVNADRLIEVCTWLRGAQLGFPRLCESAMEPSDITDRLQDAGIPHAFGAITAANEWSFYEPAPSIQIYVPPKAVSDTRTRLDDSNSPSGKQGRRRTKIEIYSESPANLPVAYRDLATLADKTSSKYGPAYRAKDVTRRSGAKIPVTTRFVSLLDCLVHPDGASHAAFMRSTLVSRVTHES